MDEAARSAWARYSSGSSNACWLQPGDMPLDNEQAEVIESFSNHSFAEAAISLLALEGIVAVIHADDAGGELPNLGFARGVRVLVAGGDAERARLILGAGSEEAD